MTRYIIKRLLALIPLLVLISIAAFLLIQLPPGSYIDSYVASREASGLDVDQATVDALTRQYGLDKPIFVQYFRWVGNFLLRGDLGMSFAENRPVVDLLRERVPVSLALALLSLLFVFLVGVPIGIYSATHQYSVTDYTVTFLGFFGLATPPFLLAIVVMWVVYRTTGHAIVGLFSVRFVGEAWSFARLWDLLKNIWLPVVIVGAARTAEVIRITRGNLLDELNKQYVVTARAKGMEERKLVFKYPIRVAFNPVVSTIGWMLPILIGAQILVSIVLNLNTLGPLLWRSIRSQDMYLAGSIVMVLSVFTVVGTLVSDILLVALDPRIRLDKARG